MNLARKIAFAASFGGLLALAACATSEPPTDQVAVTNAALAHAVAAGSVEFAPTEIALARDKMVRANAAMVAKDHDGARALAQQAQAVGRGQNAGDQGPHVGDGRARRRPRVARRNLAQTALTRCLCAGAPLHSERPT